MLIQALQYILFDVSRHSYFQFESEIFRFYGFGEEIEIDEVVFSICDENTNRFDA